MGRPRRFRPADKTRQIRLLKKALLTGEEYPTPERWQYKEELLSLFERAKVKAPSEPASTGPVTLADGPIISAGTPAKPFCAVKPIPRPPAHRKPPRRAPSSPLVPRGEAGPSRFPFISVPYNKGTSLLVP